MRLASLLLPLLSLALLAAPVGAEEGKLVENPTYKEWAKFKVGALAKYEMSGEAMGGQKMVMTQKLVELTDSKAVILTSMAMDMGGQVMEMPGQKREELKMVPEGTMPAGMPKSMEKPQISEGSGSVTTPAGTFDCKWVETKGKTDEGAFTVKVWQSADVPGGMVMMESSTVVAGQEMKTAMKLIAVSKG